MARLRNLGARGWLQILLMSQPHLPKQGPMRQLTLRKPKLNLPLPLLVTAHSYSEESVPMVLGGKQEVCVSICIELGAVHI